MAGIYRSTLQRIEGGTHYPSHLVRYRLASALARSNESRLLDTVGFEDDPVSRYVVAHHREGLSTEQVGEVLRMSPEAVEADLRSALRKLGRGERAVREWAETVVELRAMREQRAWAEPDEGPDE